MKIKTLLLVGVNLSLMILFALGIWIYSITQDYSKTKYNADIAKQVNNAIFQISFLSSDYLLYHQKRAAQQWRQAHRRLSQILEDEEVIHLNEFEDLKILKSLHLRSLKLFERVEIAVNKKVKEQSDQQLLEEQRKALSSQLLSTSHQVSLIATKLAESIEVKRGDVEQQLYVLAILIFLIFFITLFMSWFFIASRIVLPVKLLKDHITNVDAEHLDEKYIPIRNDEVGELIDTFNSMAEELHKTTVSKEKLTNEIKERIRSEEELKKEQALNSTVLEGTANVVVILDISGCFVKFNHAAEMATGFSRTELLGKPVWDFVIPKEEQEGVKKVFNNLKQGNTAITANYENHWVTKSGDYRLFEWHNDVLYNEANKVSYIVAIGYDITEKRRDEIEQERIQRELNQSRKMEALGKLTGGIAHDFNNMLAIIIGYTDLALDYSKKYDDSDFTNYLNQIETAANRAKDLTAKMLSFSRVEQVDSQAIHFAPLLEENIILMRSILPSTINIDVSIANNLPDVSIVPVQFQQIIMNLMLNAKDAMDGAGVIKVSLGMYDLINKECSSCHQMIEGNWIDVVISDNGKGMSKEVVARIFEPFFTTKGPAEGTGMGMSVLHGIVKAHKGHIIINSTLGKGTSFHILFPPATMNEMNNIDDEQNKDAANIKGNGQRILIIDDQEALVDVLDNLLNSYNYRCTKKTNSQEALDLYLADPSAFDLIITDQTMPNLTGIELVQTIRDQGLDIPVIIATGYSDKIKDNKVEFENVIVLQKPVETKRLVKNVAKLLK